MKRKFVFVGIASFAVLAGVAVIGWEVFTVTDPYVVSPLASTPAPAGAKVGHSVSRGSRLLSVVSGSDVVVVADPGASFKHEVIWLVEQPRKKSSHTLREFRCELPQYATLDQIRPLGSAVPTEIQQIADGSRW